TNLNGAGIRVAQAEANNDSNPNNPSAFEVNPAKVNQPASLFTYISTAGSSNTFPNSVGAESGHADSVAGNFYGLTIGVAPRVSHIDNYEANYFYNNLIT